MIVCTSTMLGKVLEYKNLSKENLGDKLKQHRQLDKRKKAKFALCAESKPI